MVIDCNAALPSLLFIQLDTNRNCWFLTAERWFPVANGTIQHQIRVYDNYEPGKLCYPNVSFILASFHIIHILSNTTIRLHHAREVVVSLRCARPGTNITKRRGAANSA